jgi:DNA repair protein RAD7
LIATDNQSRGISAHDIRTFGRARGGQNGAVQTNQPQPVITISDTPDISEEGSSADPGSATENVIVSTSTSARKKSRASKKKPKKPSSDDDFSASDEEIDTSRYGRASFSHKKRAPAVQPGKIDFCHICSQRFTITAYTKQSPDGEGLLCHDCGAVEQSAVKKSAPKRRRTRVGKGTAKMILEGKEDSIGKLQDICIKVYMLVKLLSAGDWKAYP